MVKQRMDLLERMDGHEALRVPRKPRIAQHGERTRSGSPTAGMPGSAPPINHMSLLDRGGAQSPAGRHPEAYVEGVSTRRVDDLIKALGCDGISTARCRASATTGRSGGEFPGSAPGRWSLPLRVAGRPDPEGAGAVASSTSRGGFRRAA